MRKPNVLKLENSTLNSTIKKPENPPKLTLRKALLAKMFRDFNIPYSSVIDVNQPHYDTDIDAYSPGRINYKRLPELHSSLKRKTPCPEDDFASDT
ncbi:uncharacterized protein OCT59_021064 [Rhizophagus irregularis]|uniref:uncharacterized protein n=1 Tax=Rhizophagus irregularis TaxID=588596 RepID=UPI00332AF967|nr:hypothetical protein OCT59_021064 [Rhizophagus irregularis]